MRVFIYKNTYEFLVDQIPLNAEEKLSQGMKLVKLEKSADKWKQFFLEWVNGKDIDLVALYGGWSLFVFQLFLWRNHIQKKMCL